MAQNNALAPRSLNALVDRWESATPLEREVYRQTGMEPGLKRKNILPAYNSKTGITLPQWLYDAALTIVGPAAAAKGIPVSQDEVLNMAANIATSAYAGGAASSLAGKPIRGNIAFNAWHGSPYKYKIFDASHIGKGQGARTYGHGLYFAEKPSVAKTYAANGHLYKVDIPDEWVEKNMFDLDAVIDEQHPEVMKKLRKTDWYQPAEDALFDMSVESNPTGLNLVRYLQEDYSPEEVSEMFRQAGISGHKYFDAGSRAKEKGTRNFVIYPGMEGQVKMLERNDIPFDSPNF